MWSAYIGMRGRHASEYTAAKTIEEYNGSQSEEVANEFASRAKEDDPVDP
jgi:hypothetical protein